MSLYSDSVEVLMDFILDRLGLPRPNFEVDYLLKVANELRPDRLEAAKKYAKSEITLTFSSKILDLVYGLDSVRIVNGKDKIFGFDWTVNEPMLSEKHQKAKQLTPLWSTIGINKVSVVHFFVPPVLRFDGLACVTIPQLKELENQVMELIYDMAESNDILVRSIVLSA